MLDVPFPPFLFYTVSSCVRALSYCHASRCWKQSCALCFPFSSVLFLRGGTHFLPRRMTAQLIPSQSLRAEGYSCLWSLEIKLTSGPSDPHAFCYGYSRKFEHRQSSDRALLAVEQDHDHQYDLLRHAWSARSK